jgi:hypothetical protein
MNSAAWSTGEDKIVSRTTRTPMRFPVIAAPATPPAGHVDLYAKADKHPYVKDDTGTETDLAGGGGGITGASPARSFFLS